MIEVLPSLLTDSSDVFRSRFNLIAPYAKRIHIDIMDGAFVQSHSLTIDAIVSILSQLTYSSVIEMHLMMQDPLQEIETIAKIPHLDSVIVHEGIVTDIVETVKSFQLKGIKAGFCFASSIITPFFQQDINPDYFLVLTETKPGFSGTPFNQEILAIVPELKQKFPGKRIEVDGGINERTIPICMEKGVYSFVVNSAIFQNENPVEKFEQLLNTNL